MGRRKKGRIGERLLIRVLEVLATLKRAGAERVATALACGLDRTRFETAVVSLYDPFPGGFEPELEACGVPVFHLGKKSGFDARMYWRLRRVLRHVRPDAIHTHSYVMRYALPAARCAMVHTVHNLASREVDAIGRLIHRVGFRRGVVPVAVGEEVARTFEQVYKFAPRVIPNGIDLSRFQCIDHSRGEGVRIVSIARLEPQKNPRLLIDAVLRLPDNVRLILVGDGSLRAALPSSPRVEVRGVCPDVAAELAAADIFALSSDYEGHPVALMEAMAAGLPVVATAVGGVPEIAGDAALLVPPRDVDALTQALQRLVEDLELRRELGKRARRRSAAFDVRRMVDAYADLFERVVHR
jgi:glycosyltransferase involved in cell wall biosynthesis